jgi:transposase
LVPKGRAGALQSATQLGQERYPALQHDALGHGSVDRSRRGETTRAVFEAYVEEALAPSLRPGQVVLMDNLTAHKGERVRELIEERGCELVFLPPYSPDFNPIEQAFSKLKALLRGAGARTREALIEAMGAALPEIGARDASGFFRHCGYRVPAQLL